jgi:hypothetical protein
MARAVASVGRSQLDCHHRRDQAPLALKGTGHASELAVHDVGNVGLPADRGDVSIDAGDVGLIALTSSVVS